MGLEVATYIHQLNPNNPDGDNDPKSQGDDHFHLIKKTLLNTFANVLGVITSSHTEINYLTGITSAVLHSAQKNVANGIGGLDAAAKLLNAQMPTDPSFTTVRLTSTVQADLASSGQGFQIGAATAANIAISAAVIQARSNGSAARVDINPFGGNVILGKQGETNTNLVVQLQNNQTRVASYTGEVLRLYNLNDGNPANGGSQYNFTSYYNSASLYRLGLMGYIGDAYFYVRNENRGGGLFLQQTNAGGSVESVLSSVANGSTYLHTSGSIRFATTADGTSTYGSSAGGNGGVHTSIHELLDSSSQQRTVLGYINSADFFLRTNNPGSGTGRIIFDGYDSISAYKVMAVFDPNGTCELRHLGNARLSTTVGGVSVVGAMASSSINVNGVAGDFTNSLGEEGYQKLPGGFTIQWGRYSANAPSGNTAITFPIAFTTVYTVTATAQVDATTIAANQLWGVDTDNTTNSGFQFFANIAIPDGFTWIAIGII